MQDIEFTIENGRLYMLQCRNGKRTPKASVKIAVDMVSEAVNTFPTDVQDSGTLPLVADALKLYCSLYPF